MKETTQHYTGTDKRRAEIAAVARALILEKGYAALRTRDVAARVGISVSTLHFHVPTKNALVELVAETTLAEFLSLLPPAPNPKLPARPQLRAEVQAYYDSLKDHPELAACHTQLTQIAGYEPQIMTMLSAFERGWCQRFVEILAIGGGQGVFRPDIKPLPAALAITGTLTAFGARGPRDLTMFWPVFDEIERGLLGSQSDGEPR